MTAARVRARAMLRAGGAVFCAAGVIATLTATSGPPSPRAAVSIESPASAGSLAYGLSTGADGRTYLISD